MRYFLDAIFDPEHQAATQRWMDAGKANDDEGRRRRGEAIDYYRHSGHPPLFGYPLKFRVKAGREVTPDPATLAALGVAKVAA